MFRRFAGGDWRRMIPKNNQKTIIEEANPVRKGSSCTVFPIFFALLGSFNYFYYCSYMVNWDVFIASSEVGACKVK